MSSAFTVGLIQESVTSDTERNVAHAVERIREAAGRGAQIICLQELFNAPYFCKSQKAERFDLAEPIPGPTIERMRKLARELEIVIIVPIFERQAAGIYRNSAAVIDADGTLLGAYRKMHIPDDPLFNEKYYFTPGDSHIDGDGDHKGASGFRVWKTRYAKVGVLICWDQWYPERPHHEPPGRRDNILSDRDRLASLREGGARRGTGRCVAHHSAGACDREWRVRRIGQSCRT
jgi:Predicted amidohydrolase